MTEFGVVIVSTTSAALRAEKLLRNAGYKEQLIPTPREFSSDCGLAVRFLWTERSEVESVLAAGSVDVVAVHHLDN